MGFFTLIFALVERSQARARAIGHWDPRDPNALPTVPADPETRARQELRFGAIAEGVASSNFPADERQPVRAREQLEWPFQSNVGMAHSSRRSWRIAGTTLRPAHVVSFSSLGNGYALQGR